MTNLRAAALFVLSAVFALPACGEKASVGDYIDSADAYARNVCECEYDNPLAVYKLPAYGSREECLADFPANSAERGCVEGLFKDIEIDYSAALDCRAAAFARASSCLNSKTCTDTARGDCYEDLLDEGEDCPDIDDKTEMQLNDCLFN